MATYVYGVIVSGVVGSYVPHGIRQHVDVDQVVAANAGDVMAYDGTQWEPTAPTALPTVATHTHVSYLETAAAASIYAPIAAPDFTTSIEISAAIPKIKLHDTDFSPQEDTEINYNAGAFTLRSRAKNIFKWESYYSTYNFASMGLKFATITASAEVSNPTCVSYVDATAGNIALTLKAAADYYRLDNYYSGALLILKRTDATANTCIITPNGAETISGAATLALNGQNSFAMLQAIVGGWSLLYHYDTTAAATDTGWANLTLISPWGGPTDPAADTPTLTVPAYRKIGNIVYLEGASYSGAIATSVTMGTLPTGFRPGRDMIISGVKFNSAAPASCYFFIKTTGEILCRVLSSGYTYHLSGISFPAA